MKSFIILVSIFLLTEIQKSQQIQESNGPEINTEEKVVDFKGSSGSEKPTNGLQSIADKEGTGNAENKVEETSGEPKKPVENQESLKVRLDNMREKAKNDRETAIRNARQAYEETNKKVQKLLGEAYAKQDETKDIIDGKFQKADTIAEIIWKNKSRKWSDMRRNANDKYEELISKSNKKREEAEKEYEAAVLAADEQFGEEYAEIEKNKLEAENKHKDMLERGRTEYENAVKAAEDKKMGAEMEFWNVVNKYKKLPKEEFVKVRAKYDADMEAYERALQLAHEKWQNVLDETGTGKQYEEAVNKAVAELTKRKDLAESLRSKLFSESHDYLEEAEELKENLFRQVDADDGEAERVYREVTDRARNERTEKLQNSVDKGRIIDTLANIEMDIAQDEFEKAISIANEEFEKIIKEINKLMKDAKINTEPANRMRNRNQFPRRNPPTSIYYKTNKWN